MTARSSTFNFFSSRSTVGVIITALLTVFPVIYTPASEPVYKAYRDGLNRPAICLDHREEVTMNDTATLAQCLTHIHRDVVEAVVGVSTITPTLLENKPALRAASDFVISSGIEAYETSPMANHFAHREWAQGCSSFIDYRTHFRFKYPTLENPCQKMADGSWLCEVQELKQRRYDQRRLCLAGVK